MNKISSNISYIIIKSLSSHITKNTESTTLSVTKHITKDELTTLVPQNIPSIIESTVQPLNPMKYIHDLQDIKGVIHTNLKYQCSFNNSFSKVCLYGGADGTRTNGQSNQDLKQYSEKWGMNVTADPLGYLNWIRPGPTQQNKGPFPFKKNGFDPTTSAWTEFSSNNGWFRDFYVSGNGGSQPRERALAFVLANMFPHWSVVDRIHESSPDYHGLSSALRNKMKSHYFGSQYSPIHSCGEILPRQGDIAINLEEQGCLKDESIDIVISQDVLEHIYDANLVFKEINRTLQPGGMCIHISFIFIAHYLYRFIF